MTKNIHIGSIIKQKFDESALTPDEFAEKIHCDRTTIYDIFKRKNIDVELLLKISDALHFDFYNEIYLNTPSDRFAKKILVAVEINEKTLNTLNLPPNFVRLLLQNN